MLLGTGRNSRLVQGCFSFLGREAEYKIIKLELLAGKPAMQMSVEDLGAARLVSTPSQPVPGGARLGIAVLSDVHLGVGHIGS